MGKNLKPLDLETAKKMFNSFLKKNNLKADETPSDSELASKKAGWEKKILELEGKGKSKVKKEKKEKTAKAPRQSQKYSYPKGMEDAAERKKYRSKMRAEANGGTKKSTKKEAKPAKAAPSKKVKKSTKED